MPEFTNAWCAKKIEEVLLCMSRREDSTIKSATEKIPADSYLLASVGNHDWNFITRVAFRLVFVYEVIYSFPFPLNLIPSIDQAFAWYSALFTKLTIWTGTYVLHLTQPLVYSPMAGGDALFGWVQNLVQLMIAVAAAVVWTILDRKRTNYRSLQEWLWLYVRLVLGTAMLSYGASKVIKTQFPNIFLWRLLAPMGDSSPTGLLWSFMGYSKIYNLFTGLVEMVGGALLFVPRLATLGSLVCMGAMANVFMLNLSYDVPVKLYAFNLLLMGVYLAAPEGRRLLNVFVLNRTAAPALDPALFRKPQLNAAMLVLQIGLLVCLMGTDLHSEYARYKNSGDGSPPPPLYGIYNVDEFIVNGETHPAVFADEARWRRIVFDRFNLIGVFPAEGAVQRYRIKLDQSRKSLELSSIYGGSWKADFTFEQTSPGQLMLRGEMDGKSIQASLRRIEVKSFPLYANGFHWTR
jgi:uncharacterized membrane protein YphA (DoxX/SURF4 family)